jgi:ribosomal subunit interface protein
MDIRVSGHQVEVGEALRGHANAALRAADEKYRLRATSAQVTLGKGPHDHGFTCEIIVYAPPGLVLKAIERASEARPAFESALDKVAKQMRRNSRRQKDRNGAGAIGESLDGLAPAEERRGVG